jgi:hypothetical protein
MYCINDMGVARPCVLFSEGLNRMHYAGYDGVHWRIGLATSDDGLSWTRYSDNPVLVPGGVHIVHQCHRTGGWEAGGSSCGGRGAGSARRAFLFPAA